MLNLKMRYNFFMMRKWLSKTSPLKTPIELSTKQIRYILLFKTITSMPSNSNIHVRMNWRLFIISQKSVILLYWMGMNSVKGADF